MSDGQYTPDVAKIQKKRDESITGGTTSANAGGYTVPLGAPQKPVYPSTVTTSFPASKGKRVERWLKEIIPLKR